MSVFIFGSGHAILQVKISNETVWRVPVRCQLMAIACTSSSYCIYDTFVSILMVDYYSKMKRERERTVLFNDTLNTFYLRLYGVRHMVKDHSDSEKGNLLPPNRLLLSINSKGSFICTIPQTG